MVTGKVSDAGASTNAARHNGVSPRGAGAKQVATAAGVGAAQGIIDPSNWLQGLVILPPIAQITADTRPTHHGKAAATAPAQRDPAAAAPSARGSDAELHVKSSAPSPSIASSPFADTGINPDQLINAANDGDETAAAAVAQLTLRAGRPSSRDSEAESSMVSEELDSRTSSVSSATGSLASAGRSGSPGWPPSALPDRGPGAAGPEAAPRPGMQLRPAAEPGTVRVQKARRELAFSPDQMRRTHSQPDDQAAAEAARSPASEAPQDELHGTAAGGHPLPSPVRALQSVGSHPVDGGSSSGSEDEPGAASTPSPSRKKRAGTPVQNGVARRSVDDMPGDEDLPHGASNPVTRQALLQPTVVAVMCGVLYGASTFLHLHDLCP